MGDNSITSRLTPVSVVGAVKTFCQISAGANHNLAIDRTGRVWSWGLNANGQLGDNSITSRLTPVSVAGAVKTFCQIAGGTSFTLAIDRFGRAWGWGNNDAGQLGDNTILSKRTPVSVLGAVKTFCKIGTSLSTSFTVAIDKNGRLWSWGLNQFGQLGDNTILSKRTPVSVVGAVKTFCHILVGGSYVVAIDKNGRAWGWGTDSSGQLGLNTTNKSTPVRVCIS